MFIAKFKDGSELNGEHLTWDDLEATDENYITSIHLTLPFQAQQANGDGTFTPLPARTINLSGYHRWYYGKEATAGFMAPNGQLTEAQANGVVVAEIMGGIDDRTGHVFQVRVGKDGNITTNHFQLKQLTQADHAIRVGRPYKN